jgi:hypothetical protein
MQEIEVTWKHAIIIWWAVVWRTVLFVALAGMGVGLVLGFLLAGMQDEEQVALVAETAGLLVGIPIGIWVMKTVLTRQFRDFRIALVPSTEAKLENAL